MLGMVKISFTVTFTTIPPIRKTKAKS